MTTNRLKFYRRRKNWPQKKLAEISGISVVSISFIENHLVEPMDLTKMKLAGALGVPIAELFLSKEPQTMHLLRLYRIKKGMTQTELANASGISQVTISFIESYRVGNPTEITKRRLARALKVSREKIFPST